MDSETQGTISHGRAADGETEDECKPPPMYTVGGVGNASGVKAQVGVTEDGRVNIDWGRRSSWLSQSLVSVLQTQERQTQDYGDGLQNGHRAQRSPSVSDSQTQPPPILNVVFHVVGSRGDVQPFIALGRVLRQTYHHNVRLATHPVFKELVESNGLDFFSIGGNPAELMAYMVKNPGLLPSMDALLDGDVKRHREGMYKLMEGCWRACIESGNGMDSDAVGSLDDTFSVQHRVSSRPFVADVIIANPPSFAHIHCAQKLGIPLHLMFTMPWSPTQSFPQPLANIHPSNSDSGVVNYLSYILVETLFWQGLGSIVNRFRDTVLGLEPIRLAWGPRMASRLQIPYTYCWSPSLIPKPRDWGFHISVAGFFFLPLADDFTPDAALAAFLAAGPPPIYIGFGSIVVEHPDTLTEILFEAIRKTGYRAVVSKGWGGLGSHTPPANVFITGDVPHDWLFKRVGCVVHHGGAGTTAAAMAAGKPSIVVPFFGDQAFWGAMVWRAGIGPRPIPAKALTADLLATAIEEALQPSMLERARDIGQVVINERGADDGAMSFHRQLNLDGMRCSLAPHRAAVWKINRSDIQLSALAATALLNAHLLRIEDLKLYQTTVYDLECPPWDPITGVISACLGMAGNMCKSLADIPNEVNRAIKSNSTRSAPQTAASNSYRNSSNIALGAMRGFSKGIGRILLAGFRSPFEVTLASARGFHNVPLLYGDQSVRKLKRITGVASGLEEVGKEIGYGVYDGVTGLFTHPIDGYRREGAVGLAKGLGKGLGGAVLKPIAAVWGIPGYTFEGIAKETQRLFSSATKSHIALARLAQGSQEYNAASKSEIAQILSRWRSMETGGF